MHVLAESDLPPRPDPVTGQPRPPRATRVVNTVRPKKKPADGPRPPDGQGPLLEWSTGSHQQGVTNATWIIPLFVVGMTLERVSLDWTRIPVVWLGLPVLMALFYFLERAPHPAVGAEWLMVGREWVRLYELTCIRCRDEQGSRRLELTDSAGRHVRIKVDHVQHDRDLWDLVYNGLLHSTIAGRAHTNLLVHGLLDVPLPEHKGP